MTPAETAQALPYPALVESIRAVLKDREVVVPARLVQALPGGGSLFVMPALDGKLALTKLITFTPQNAGTAYASIQGDIVVFDIATGRRIALLDGPTVTARRTAAVSLLAAQTFLAMRASGRGDSKAAVATQDGPMLIIGAGVQGRSHLEAFRAGMAVQEVWIYSRSSASALALVEHARTLGMIAKQIDSVDVALASCPIVISTTPAQEVAIRGYPRDDAFIAAVGAFTPKMVEWDAAVCNHLAEQGNIFVDTRDADHEAGDLLQAGLDVTKFPSLEDAILNSHHVQAQMNNGPIFFKSCGWAGWDLAAARCANALTASSD
jgi:1-piperideine-2-carboxylate/1-pyrroline-2-carboxylate reductase [NAD(P)H]